MIWVRAGGNRQRLRHAARDPPPRRGHKVPPLLSSTRRLRDDCRSGGSRSCERSRMRPLPRGSLLWRRSGVRGQGPWSGRTTSADPGPNCELHSVPRAASSTRHGRQPSANAPAAGPRPQAMTHDNIAAGHNNQHGHGDVEGGFAQGCRGGSSRHEGAELAKLRARPGAARLLASGQTARAGWSTPRRHRSATPHCRRGARRAALG